MFQRWPVSFRNIRVGSNFTKKVAYSTYQLNIGASQVFKYFARSGGAPSRGVQSTIGSSLKLSSAVFGLVVWLQAA